MRDMTKKSNINLDCYLVEMGFEYVLKNLFKSKNICQTIIAIQLFIFATRIKLRPKLHQNLVSIKMKNNFEKITVVSVMVPLSFVPAASILNTCP